MDLSITGFFYVQDERYAAGAGRAGAAIFSVFHDRTHGIVAQRIVE